MSYKSNIDSPWDEEGHRLALLAIRDDINVLRKAFAEQTGSIAERILNSRRLPLHVSCGSHFQGRDLSIVCGEKALTAKVSGPSHSLARQLKFDPQFSEKIDLKKLKLFLGNILIANGTSGYQFEIGSTAKIEK